MREQRLSPCLRQVTRTRSILLLRRSRAAMNSPLSTFRPSHHWGVSWSDALAMGSRGWPGTGSHGASSGSPRSERLWRILTAVCGAVRGAGLARVTPWRPHQAPADAPAARSSPCAVGHCACGSTPASTRFPRGSTTSWRPCQPDRRLRGRQKRCTRLLGQVDERRNPRTKATLN
jgi:hypothetical protein